MPNTSSGRRDIIVMGGSAGALESLRCIVSRLPADLPAAILLVVHVAQDYPSILPEILSACGSLRAIHPHNKQRVENGMIYVAPPDHHLLLEDASIVLSRGPRENRHRPAIDPLFRSAARTYDARVAGVILSGELDDGSAGLMAVRMRGGIAIVQDPNEAIAPEMPRRAIQYAGADYVLPAAAIAELLIQLAARTESTTEPAREFHMPHKSAKIDEEARQANLENDPPAKQAGQPSTFVCPECHGTLWELEEGGLLRFRCRVGHAYTADSLRLAFTQSTEEALWVAMRALEEKAALLRRLASRSAERMAANYRQEAEAYDKHVESIRRILLANQAVVDREEHRSDAA